MLNMFFFFFIYRCSTNFWFGRRKHHCRVSNFSLDFQARANKFSFTLQSCGRLFCRDCSSHMIPIPSEQLYHPVRVCDDCFVELEKEQAQNEVLMHKNAVQDVIEAVECELKSPN